jgi:hypothetical protein
MEHPRTISLFGDKYQATFEGGSSREQCDAFATGVEAVLNHMTEAPSQSAEQAA